MGGILGACGAFLSVALKGSEIYDPPKYSKTFYHIFKGALRVLIGAMLGGIFILLNKADLIMGILSNNYAIALFSLISGFSERYVINILENIQKEEKEENVPKCRVSEEVPNYGEGRTK
ncbi:membrane protein [Candidatus Magnetoovum chiemensis]|nr:membrane protein [Candidatus Magnetoovum chiemensis]